MFKILISFIAGAGVATIVLNHLWEDRSWNLSTIGPKEYYHDGAAEYTFSDVDSIPLAGEYTLSVGLGVPFRISNEIPLMTIGPEHVDFICMDYSYNEDSDRTLFLYTFLKPEYHEEMIATMKNNVGQTLGYTFRGQTILTFMPARSAINAYEEVGDRMIKSGFFPEDREPTFGFGTGNKKRELMWLAQYFSPDTAPVACNENSELTYLSWWPLALKDLWPMLSEAEKEARYKDAEKIVNEIFKPEAGAEADSGADASANKGT